jgi:hypothetical protein
MQYQGIKGRELFLELSKEEKLPGPETHLNEFFDSYEDLTEYSEIFFEACEDLPTEDCDDRNLPLDMGLDSIYRIGVLVYFTNMQYRMWLTIHSIRVKKIRDLLSLWTPLKISFIPLLNVQSMRYWTAHYFLP